jgi:hypothetical protein
VTPNGQSTEVNVAFNLLIHGSLHFQMALVPYRGGLTFKHPSTINGDPPAPGIAAPQTVYFGPTPGPFLY